MKVLFIMSSSYQGFTVLQECLFNVIFQRSKPLPLQFSQNLPAWCDSILYNNHRTLAMLLQTDCVCLVQVECKFSAMSKGGFLMLQPAYWAILTKCQSDV